ncbi:MAG: hypothetical protein MR026_09855 [Lachnoclostridium sp.]|uniref:sodium:solute symporter family transporter n=1 Tax=uncultured Clostridium sp. TaxID=59620 RepID=UPI00265FD502|nr:hypothetical protein [uncultured Clostridium sp.]MCI5804504.1 hypothetical protein [Lachnoclostridium sp.]
MNIPLLIVILYVLLLFCISIYVSYGQKKDSENFLLYKGKNNAFVVAASIAGLAIGGASTIGIAENAFTVGLSAGWYDTAWAIGAVVSSMLAVRYLRRSQYTTISGLVRDLYGTKTSLIMVIAMCIIQSGIIALQYKAGGSILASLLPDAEASVALPMILMSIPPVLGGITLSGLWAADMGTGCSMIIGLATTVSTDIIGKIPGVSLNDRQKHILNKVIVVLSSLVTYLIATQMGAILSAMQKALSLAIGTSFIVIGGLLCPKFSSRKAGFWTIMASIVSIVAWNMVPALVPVFKNVGFFMLAVCGAVFILISLVDPEKVKQ